jgi:hemerythrin-like metal-binding protein
VESGDPGGDLRLGVPEIDGQHAVQVQLIDAVRSAVDRGAEGAEVGELFWRLHDFTRSHFLAEHALMRLHAYPLREAHEREHDRLLGQLDRLRESFLESRDRAFASVVAESLRLWLIVHIQTMDQAFVAHLRQSAPPAPGERGGGAS